MKTFQISALTICALLLTGVANAQTVTVQHTMDYQDTDWDSGYWFVEPAQVLDHYPFCRGSNQDWGWTHDLSNMVPNGASGIKSATLTIVAWKIDVEDGEDDVVYVLPEQPAITISIRTTGTMLGLLKSYLEAPITVSWPAEGQVGNYADLWSVTTFDLPQSLIDTLWTNEQMYVHIDIDQNSAEGMRATIKSAVLRVEYFAPEAPAVSKAAVHRFWSPVLSGHFYTMNEQEKQWLIENYPAVWTYEGIAYQALTDANDPLAAPVYRFWSPTLGGHFYTINEEEANSLQANFPDVWTFEGPAFYAYPTNVQPPETYPVYRFWSGTLGHHFYTMNEEEKLWLIANYPDVWTYEGIAWYAFMP